MWECPRTGAFTDLAGAGRVTPIDGAENEFAQSGDEDERPPVPGSSRARTTSSCGARRQTSRPARSRWAASSSTPAATRSTRRFCATEAPPTGRPRERATTASGSTALMPLGGGNPAHGGRQCKPRSARSSPATAGHGAWRAPRCSLRTPATGTTSSSMGYPTSGTGRTQPAPRTVHHDPGPQDPRHPDQRVDQPARRQHRHRVSRLTPTGPIYPCKFRSGVVASGRESVPSTSPRGEHHDQRHRADEEKHPTEHAGRRDRLQ